MNGGIWDFVESKVESDQARPPVNRERDECRCEALMVLSHVRAGFVAVARSWRDIVWLGLDRPKKRS